MDIPAAAPVAPAAVVLEAASEKIAPRALFRLCVAADEEIMAMLSFVGGYERLPPVAVFPTTTCCPAG